jgi:hypothetical protein
MKQEHLEQFTASVEQALMTAFGLTELAVDPEGDWPFAIDGARIWARVVAEPDLHVYLFTRVAEAIAGGEETLREVNRLNAVMTAGSLVLTGQHRHRLDAPASLHDQRGVVAHRDRGPGQLRA